MFVVNEVLHFWAGRKAKYLTDFHEKLEKFCAAMAIAVVRYAPRCMNDEFVVQQASCVQSRVLAMPTRNRARYDADPPF